MNATGDALEAGLLMYSEGAVVGRIDARSVEDYWALKGGGRSTNQSAYSALGSVRRSGVGEPEPFLGRRRVNVEPVPGVLFARIWPPWDSAIWRAIDNPRPAPPSEREGSALWKRSKMRGS